LQGSGSPLGHYPIFGFQKKKIQFIGSCVGGGVVVVVSVNELMFGEVGSTLRAAAYDKVMRSRVYAFGQLPTIKSYFMLYFQGDEINSLIDV